MVKSFDELFETRADGLMTNKVAIDIPGHLRIDSASGNWFGRNSVNGRDILAELQGKQLDVQLIDIEGVRYHRILGTAK